MGVMDTKSLFGKSLLRGQLLKGVTPPLKLQLQTELSHYLEQGSEGLIDVNVAAEVAFRVCSEFVHSALATYSSDEHSVPAEPQPDDYLQYLNDILDPRD